MDNHIEVSWSDIKQFALSRGLSIQWLEIKSNYYLKAFDGPFNLSCILPIDDPKSDDCVDFETNFKASGNRKLDPRDADGNIIISRKPVQPIYKFENLLRNGSRNMNVGGTLAAPAIFEFAPPVGEIWQIERLIFGMDDVGLTDMGLFGGMTALPNGLLVSIRTRGLVQNIGVIKDNVDVAMIFPGQSLGQSGVLDTSDGLYGTMVFNDQIHLYGDSGDHIRIAVRDDLRSINILRSMVVVRKVI